MLQPVSRSNLGGFLGPLLQDIYPAEQRVRKAQGWSLPCPTGNQHLLCGQVWELESEPGTLCPLLALQSEYCCSGESCKHSLTHSQV